MQSTWLLAQPTPGQVRAGDPLADPAFHHEMATRLSARSPGPSCDRSILLGERLARSRGPGGRTVAGSWAGTGVEVTVIADADPRRQSATRQLLVDGSVAVEQWARNVRSLGATGACWHTDAESPRPMTGSITIDHAREAEIASAIALAGLAPMLWVTRSGSPLHGVEALKRIGDLLHRAAGHGADLSRLTVCLPLDPSARSWRGRLGAVVADLRLCIPAEAARVLVVVPRDRLHLAQGDAYELSRATEPATPWPVEHCAGDLALRQVGGWWREPGLSRRAAHRFETIVGQLSRPTGAVYVRGHESGTEVPELLDPPGARARRIFDTSLFRNRSLYRSRTTQRR